MPLKVDMMLSLGGTEDAPQDHVVIRVVPGVPGGYIPEHTAVCTKYVIRLGPNLLDLSISGMKKTWS